MAPKNYTLQKNSDHEEENNNADGEQQMEDSNNSQNAPDGLGDTCPTSALPASSPSSEDEREWNSRFDPTTPNGGCFWMALNSDGSVAGCSSSNTHGPSTTTMQIAEVMMGLIQRREQEDAQSSQAAANDAARPKAKPKPKARFLNYKKKDRKKN